MAISSVTFTSLAPSGTTANTAVSNTAALIAATTGTTAPSAGVTSPPTSATLSTLSEQAAIVATLGAGNEGFQTYDATGLLTQVTQAATLTVTGADTSGANSTGTAPSADWGTILKTHPALTSTAVADAVAQGIVNTLSVYA